MKLNAGFSQRIFIAILTTLQFSAGALGAFAGKTAKSGVSFACVDTGAQLSDSSRLNTYRTGNTILSELHAKLISSKPVARNTAGALMQDFFKRLVLSCNTCHGSCVVMLVR